jgi:transposase
MNEAKRNEIVRLHEQGLSGRRIAALLHVSRDTVTRVLQQVAQARGPQTAPPAAPPRPRPRRCLDDYTELIAQLLGRYPDLTAQRLFEELRQRGFVGSYPTVWRRLQELRPAAVRPPVVRFETAPGAQAQMDYATYTIAFTATGPQRVQLFSYLLGYSRRQYLQFVARQDFETTLRQHVAAFAHLGGAAACCLYDNFKVVVQGWEDDEPLYNPRFLAFATHYGFRPWACRPRRPQTKGKVERPFHYVETNLLCGRDFRDVAHLNAVTACWLAEVADVRVHGETGQRPLDRHAEEVPHLLALPALAYDVSPVVYRHVSAEGLVAWQGNYYSTPWRLIGRLLAVRITADEVIVHGPHLEEVARHRLFSAGVSGQRCVQPEHLPQANERLRRAELEERFAEFGPQGPRFLGGLVQAKRYGWDQAHKVLELLTVYRRVDVQAALERAVRFGAFGLSSVQRILAATARPRPLLEVLAEEEQRRLEPLLRADPVAPRPLAEYQHLCGEQARDGKTTTEPAAPAGGGECGDNVGPASATADGPGGPEGERDGPVAGRAAGPGGA